MTSTEDKEQAENPELTLIISGSCMVASSSLINPNAFPTDIEKEVIAAITKLSLFFTAKTELVRSLESAREDMFKHLNQNWVDLKKASTTRSDAEVVAYSDGLVYMSNFNMFLYELKSFLDIFARIISRLVDNSVSPVHGFNKGKIDGQQISGGKFLNWINNLPENSFENKKVLSSFIYKNCAAWVHEAVKYRDDLAHYKGIEGLKHMRISVTNSQNELERDNILDPVLPNDVGIIKYSNSICESMGEFIEQVLAIIPNVKNELNTSWKVAKEKL